jgi:hypothetical protein
MWQTTPPEKLPAKEHARPAVAGKGIEGRRRALHEFRIAASLILPLNPQ